MVAASGVSAADLFLLSSAAKPDIGSYAQMVGHVEKEELNSAGTTQVCDAANFVTRRRAVRAAQRLYSHLTIQKELFRVFKGPFVPADSERSQNFDLGRCRFQGPIRSPSLEGKGLSHAKIGVKTGVKLFHQL